MKLNKFLAVILTLFACIAPARADWYQFAGGGGGGGGSGTVGSGNTGQVAYYQSTGTTVIGNSNMNVSAGALSLGISTASAGSVVLFGGTSGSVTISTAAVAGTGTVFQLPATNGTNGQVLQTNGSGVTSWVNAGTGSGTVNSGTGGQMTWYATTGTAVSGNANANISNGALTLGQSTSVAGSLILEGATSGAVTVNVPATAGSTTFQLPGTNGTNNFYLQTNGSGVTSWTQVPFTSISGSVTAAQMLALAQGDVYSGNGSNQPAATPTPTLGVAGSTAGTLTLSGVTSGTATIQTAAVAGTATVFQLPANNGTNLQFLQTNGSGVTSWQTSPGSGTVNSGTGGQGTYYATTGTAVSGNPNENWSIGTVTIGQANSVAGAIVLEGGTSGAVTVGVPGTAGSTTFTLPGSNGSNGQFLQTNGSGVTSWQTVSGSGTVNSGTATQLAYYATSTNAVSSAGDATIASGVLTLGGTLTPGSVVLDGGTSGTATISVPLVAGTTTFQLPGSNGSANQFLQTNGSGVTSWQTVSGSGTVNSGTANQVAWYATSSTAVSGNTNMTIATGALSLGQSGTAGSVTLNGATSGTCLVSVSATAGSTTFQLPSTNGSSGQFLQTNGSGVTSWQTASGSGTVNSGTANQMTYYATTGTAVSGNANATIINGSMTLGQSATAGALVLNGSSSGTVTIQTAAAAGTGTVFQLPATNGTNQYFLQTNGSGVTSWANVLPASATATTQTAGDNTTSVATDAFVTTAISNAIAGVNPAVAVTAATTGVLPNSPTYSNGVSGIGATLTAGSNTTLTIDGVTFSALTQSALVKNQASAFQNGIYNVTQVGSGILPWILTRRIDYDQPSDINNTGAIPVISGTANTDTSWILTSTVNTVGTDALTYTQFTLNPTTIATTPGGTANQIAYFSSTGNQISGNANVTVSTGALTLGQSATAGSVILNGATTGTVTVNVPATAGSTTFTLPGTNGVANQYLQSNGSGVTTWNYVTDIGGNGSDGAVTKTTQTETSPVATNATTWTNTNADTYTVLSGSQINATSTIAAPGILSVAAATGAAVSNTTSSGNGVGPGGGFRASAVTAGAAGGAGAGNGGSGAATSVTAGRLIALGYGYYGSGGGSGFGASSLLGGTGGGYVRLCAGTTLTLNSTGTISAVGGASSASATNSVSGGGGGSGGGVFLYGGTSITLTSGGTVTVAGGNAGAMSGTSAFGGGGGSGGYVFEESPSNTGAGTITLTGGTATGSTNNGNAGGTGVSYAVTDTPTMPLVAENERQWNDMVDSGWIASNHKIGHEAPMFAVARANAICFGDGQHWATKGHGHAQFLAAWRAKDYCEFERLCSEFEEGEDLEGHGKTCLLFIGDIVEVPAA